MAAPGDRGPSELNGDAPGTIGRTGDVDHDLVVVGAGSAAFASAIKASEAGYRVAMVEQGTLGGTCVNVGCVPSKALLRAGEVAWAAGHHPFSGLATSSGPVDLAALVAQKDELVDALRRAKYEDLVTAYGWTVVGGHARFVGPDELEVGAVRLRAGRFLVATGASPVMPPVPGLAEAGALTSTGALALTEVPRRLVVLGANAVGLELGQYFLHLGAEVTFVDVAPRIAPFEEPEVSAAVAGVLVSEGAAVSTSTQVLAVRRAGGQIELEVDTAGHRRRLLADQVVVATGRRPNTDGLGLDVAGVEVDRRGAVVVDERLRTSNPRIFAAGDVTGGPQFVYVSAYQGALAVDNALLGADQAADYTGLPRVIFTAPQVAGAGMTEAQARQAGVEVQTAVLSLDAVPRALVNRATAGVVKLVAERDTGRLLGASMVADGAGEAIQTAVMAIRQAMTVSELAATFHPYLTMVEGLKLAAQTFTRDVTKLSCCA